MFGFFSASVSVQDNPYSGFQGLNIDTEGFQAQVMSHDDIRVFFVDGRQYHAPFAYPRTVAEGFNEPPVFSALVEENGIQLTGSLVTNEHPTNCLGSLAKIMLPTAYIAHDHLAFLEEPGFGPGSVRISSERFNYPDGREATLAELMLGVNNRPGMFLKIADSSQGGSYTDMAIFFPAQVSGLGHYPVRHGEAFVLVAADLVLDDQRISDICSSFDRLVRKSYGDEGLCTVKTGEEVLSPSAAPQPGA